jgi:ATP-dependent helicase/nuclease subunit A
MSEEREIAAAATATPAPRSVLAPLVDAEARERIRSDLDSTLVVEAAAGTGKTTELVGRVLALLRTGRTTLPRIVAVTFTERAAGEMKLRLRSEIEKARTAESMRADERARLDGALAELEEARISTIHGFCADLLRERAVEAEVDPLFEVAADEERERLYGESFERWFQQNLANPSEGVRRALRRRSREYGALSPRDVLRRAGSDLIEQRDFDAPYRRDPLDREGSIDAMIERVAKLSEYAALAKTKDDYLAQNLVHVRRFITELRNKEGIRGGRDHDGIESELRELIRGKQGKSFRWKGSSRNFPSSAVHREALELRDQVHQELLELLDRLDADLAACLKAELSPLIASYEERKTRTGKLDFLDLLLVARNLLRDHGPVRKELQQKFSHLLVDEFQDTDPLQAEILLLLSADDPEETDPARVRPVPGKLFTVGDPKQSIYRFRRADVALYESIKRALVLRGASVVHLTTSFRGVPSLQQAVNAAFAPLMRGSEDGSQADYVPLMAHRSEPRSRPSVIALPVPRPYAEWGKIVKYRIEQSIPDAVGAFVDYLVRQSGMTITERDRPVEPVPVQARHICLLFKRFQQFGEDVTRPYVRALEARHLPHVLVGGRSFYSREEVWAIRNALRAIEWPDDELSVYATLRGPFFAIGDDSLLAFRHAYHRLSPVRRYESAGEGDWLADVRDALAVLGHLHRARNRRPIADTLTELLETTRAHAGVAIWPTGEQALGNILRVLDVARRFEAGGATSFRSFVVRLDEEAERGGAAEAPVVEEGTDGVRIMTVHKAKGLEFPVVILVDPTASATAQKPSRYIDPERKLWAMPLAQCSPVELTERRDLILRHDTEEAVRLAYVAATRAREMLVVPVVGDAFPGDESASGWLDVLHPALFPEPADRRSSSPAPGCPPFGEDSVFERPATAGRGVESSVRPGLHRPAAGEHTVVWWDPSALELDKRDEVGLRQQRILAADQGELAAVEGERAHQAWVARRGALLASGEKPSFRVTGVTEIAAREAHGEGAPALVDLAPPPRLAVERTDVNRRDRPHGTRFGILVHAVLQAVDFRATDEDVAMAAKAQGRLLNAPEVEVEAAADATVRALLHPLLRRAERAGVCRREAPIVTRMPDGSLVEGVLDLAFRDMDAQGALWTIVDFKTDIDIASRLKEYERQVSLYAQAVTVATGERAEGVLLLL